MSRFQKAEILLDANGHHTDAVAAIVVPQQKLA